MIKEISTMSAKELRLSIAKARGYEDRGVMNDGAHVFLGPDGEYCYLDGSPFEPVLPDWTVEIAAAWGLVEEMLYYNVQSLDGKTYKAVLFPVRNLMKGRVGTGPTIEIAICRAWLLCKEATL